MGVALDFPVQEEVRAEGRRFRSEDCFGVFRGDYELEGDPALDVQTARKTVGASSIVSLRSRMRLLVRRSWPHIREDATNMSLLWFAGRGRISVSRQNASSAATEGNFLITNSMSPFVVEWQAEGRAVHELLLVIVPTHTLRRYMPDDLIRGFAGAVERPELALAEGILASVLADDGEMAADTHQMLLGSALSLLSHALRGSNARGPLRQSLTDRRLQDILRFIEANLSNANLSPTMAARACGISPRYVSFLLRSRGVQFSTLVWEQRLKNARLWLSAADATDTSIGEIAYSLGFKSQAHFSRRFKRAFKMSPSEYRTARCGREGGETDPCAGAQCAD